LIDIIKNKQLRSYFAAGDFGDGEIHLGFFYEIRFWHELC
jgi:hypothetical protein